MNYVFQFFGDTRLRVAREFINTVLAEWSAQWRVDDARAPLAIVISAAQAGDDELANPCRRVRTAHGNIAVICETDDWRRLVFGSAAEIIPADDIARHLLDDAMNALLQGIAGNAPVAPVTTQQQIAGKARITVCVQVPVNAAQAATLSLQIDASCFDYALAHTQPSLPAGRRQDVIGHAKIALELTLPVAMIRADELCHLRPGMVIRSEQPLTMPLALGTQEQRGFARAFLGQQGLHKALRLSLPRQPGAPDITPSLRTAAVHATPT